MRKDYELLLCSGCEFRPIDPDTAKPVEGGLRVGERALKGCMAVVIYSTVDPRINNQFRIGPDIESDQLIREADHCSPIVQGASSPRFTMGRLKYENPKPEVRICPLTDLVSYDGTLPKDLLYETDLARS